MHRMLTVMSHRGPDDSGIYVRRGTPSLILGHRRLSIFDPDHGHQPMTTPDGKLTVVFNGAIYNYLELRRELVARGHTLKTHCDTEIILYAYAEWGHGCTTRFRGMFAFALWDQERNRLFCARDRIGVKPFYFSVTDERLVFASEIKAIITSGLHDAQVDVNALQDYVTFHFCLGDKTLFRGIHKLKPGFYLVAEIERGRLLLNTSRYWDVSYTVDDEHDERFFRDKLASQLEESVTLHLRSDVPLGAQLSGGIDSSAIVCLAAPMFKDSAFKSFTGAFRGEQYDETRHAKTVSEFTQTENYQIYIPESGFSDVITDLIYYMDEPAAGPGLMPQYYVSKMAAEHVKVVLGGQGGDEVFIGYARYLVAYLEHCLKAAIFDNRDDVHGTASLASLAPNLTALQSYIPMLKNYFSAGVFGEACERYFRLIQRGDGVNSVYTDDVTATPYSSYEAYQEIFNRSDLGSIVNRMQYFDLKESLPALLHVEDRTSMAASIESRVPLLDHHLVEFTAAVPTSIKFANGRLRHLLRKTLRNRVPSSILDRKDKMGFPVPLQRWYRSSGRDFVRDTLFSDRARQRGIYNHDKIQHMLRREQVFGREIWGVLCLELWHQLFIDGDVNNRIGH